MRYQTHLATTNCLGLPIMFMTNQFDLVPLIALNIGAIFPDIDSPNSYIGFRLKFSSGIISKLFGHRGIMHSLFSIGLVSVLFTMGAESLGIGTDWIRWFTLGYLLHLIEDGFSKTGVAFFAPLSNNRIQLGFNKIYYTTGNIGEKIIFWLALIGLVFLLIQFHTDKLIVEEINKFFNST